MNRYYTQDKQAFEARTPVEAASIAYGPGNHDGISMWSRDHWYGWIEHVLGSGSADIIVDVPPWTSPSTVGWGQ